MRKNAALEDDAVHITPVQAIIGGLAGAALFVALLVMLVQIVTG